MPPTSLLKDSWPVWLGTVLLFACLAAPVRANVYPTNIKINDSLANVTVSPGTNVRISYILNEPASAGVTVHVLSSGSEVRNIALEAGSQGTMRGTNTVIWDGKDNASNSVAVGTYSIAVTAASHGYSVWTQTTDDNTNGNVVFQGRGIAVDQNTNSFYYGRVFVANATASDPGQNDWLGFQVGIVKCNADGSYADEGGFSTGGYPWAGDSFSPWHVEISKDDFVYVNDFTTNGQVIHWDATLSTGSEAFVLRPDNWASLNVSLSGPAISGAGTGQALWMADATFSSTKVGLGILQYPLQPNGTCALNDMGTVAVAVGGSLTSNPVDVALDSAGNIFTIQANDDPADPSNRVFRFRPFNPATDKSPITNADWAVGANDSTMVGPHGIAVDPTGTYLAVAFEDPLGTNSCTQIFYASNGIVVTNLDLGVEISGLAMHQDEDCAWDAVGNVYYIDSVYGAWRAVSPPGTNQATTVALATVQITTGGGGGPTAQPKINDISVTGGIVTIDFSAGSNDVASAFSVQAAASVTGPYSQLNGATIVSIAPGQFRATFPAGSGVQYFRIAGQRSTPPPSQLSFSSITAAGGSVVLTFNANTSDVASAFTLLSSATAQGPYAPNSSATIAELSPGVFQASVPASGPLQFYRLKK